MLGGRRGGGGLCPEWYIVGDKRRLVPSLPDRRHFVKVTRACTVAGWSPRVHLPPAGLSVFAVSKRARQTQSAVSLLSKGRLCVNGRVAPVSGSFLKSLRASLKKKKNGYKGCSVRLILNQADDVKANIPFCSCGMLIYRWILLFFIFRKRNSHSRQRPEDTYFSSSGKQPCLSSPVLMASYSTC